jgi:hypothetical protein
MEECPSMDAAIHESLETATIKPDPEDSNEFGYIYWDDLEVFKDMLWEEV